MKYTGRRQNYFNVQGFKRAALADDDRPRRERGQQVWEVEPGEQPGDDVPQWAGVRPVLRGLGLGDVSEPVVRQEIVEDQGVDPLIEHRHTHRRLRAERVPTNGDAVWIDAALLAQPVEDVELLKHGQSDIVAAEHEQLTAELVAAAVNGAGVVKWALVQLAHAWS